jgi:hypothetical protein
MATNRIAGQGLWIGAGFGSMNDSSLFMPGQLGMVVIKNDKAYQLVKFHASTSTIANGTPVAWDDYDDFVVTAETDDNERNAPAGVALGSQTAAYYGWIQVDGVHTAIKEANLFAVDDVAVIGTTDGTALPVAAGTAPTHIPLAVCTTASSGGVFGGRIIAPHNGW